MVHRTGAALLGVAGLLCFYWLLLPVVVLLLCVRYTVVFDDPRSCPWVSPMAHSSPNDRVGQLFQDLIIFVSHCQRLSVGDKARLHQLRMSFKFVVSVQGHRCVQIIDLDDHERAFDSQLVCAFC